MSDFYKPRFSFEISEELKIRADRVLANYGQRKTTFTPILEDVLDLIEEHGPIVIGAILAEAIKAREVLPILVKAEERVKK